jgi:IclR family pca regulon transcriptional regulator
MLVFHSSQFKLAKIPQKLKFDRYAIRDILFTSQYLVSHNETRIMNKDSPYYIEALARGLEVLSLFSRERPSLAMSEVVELTGLNKATAYRVLSTLEAVGYLNRNAQTKRYSPSLKVLTLGFTAINNLDVRQVARPYLEQLSQELNLTTSLGILDGLWVVYADRIRNRAIVGILLGLGDRIPVHCSSMGKVMLAYLPEPELEIHLGEADLIPCTPRSIASMEVFKAELLEVKQQGFAFNDGELYSGLRAIAAPIFNSKRQVVAAVNVSGSQDEVSQERLHQVLPAKIMKTAISISQALQMAGK